MLLMFRCFCERLDCTSIIRLWAPFRPEFCGRISQEFSENVPKKTQLSHCFRFNSERGVRSGRESDLIWRRANNPSSSDEKKPPSSSSLSERSGTTTVNAATTTSASSSTTTVTTKSSPPNRGSCFFPNKPAVSWSAVNSELKSKQKIAKVCALLAFFDGVCTAEEIRIGVHNWTPLLDDPYLS